MQVTIIGAGSVQFSRVVMADILTHDAFREGVTFSLMDVDREALDFGKALAHSIAGTLKARVNVRGTTNRRRALEGSDFVVVTIRSGGADLMERDREIALRYELRQTVADTVGIGGIFNRSANEQEHRVSYEIGCNLRRRTHGVLPRPLSA